jgi:hypothetical protein
VIADGSPILTPVLSNMVLGSPLPTEQLAPVLLRMSPSGIEIVAERPEPAPGSNHLGAGGACDCATSLTEE